MTGPGMKWYRQDSDFDFQFDGFHDETRSAEWLSLAPTPIWEKDGFTFHRYGKNTGRYFVYDQRESRIKFIIAYHPVTLEFHDQPVIETHMWRASTFWLSGAGDKIMCDFLVPEFGCVVSSIPLVAEADTYWVDRILGAHHRHGLESGLHEDGKFLVYDPDSSREWLEQHGIAHRTHRPVHKRFFIRKPRSP